MTRIVQLILDFFRRIFGNTQLPEPAPTPDPPPVPPDLSEPVEDPETPPTVVPVEPPRGEEPEMTRPTLSRGSADKDAVRELQSLLNKNGEKITVDGDFGPGTEKAVKGFQLSYGLTETGVADQAVWAVLDRIPYNADPAYTDIPLPSSRPVNGSSGVAKAWNSYGNLLGPLAASLGIAPAAACAVLAVESAGAGFWNGRMVIRFENHIFYKYWGKTHAELFSGHFRMDADKSWQGHAWRDGPGDWRPLHTKEAGQDEEWAVLDFARHLPDGDSAALMSISMGAPQIMGFNAGKVGFDSVQAMFEAFSKSDRAHVLGLFDFIRSDHKMVRGLRTGDWRGFAYIYNGPGQADYYGGKIGENTEAAKKLGVP